ncbi:MAG: Hpt domain-containing protein, partial [bacterium]
MSEIWDVPSAESLSEESQAFLQDMISTATAYLEPDTSEIDVLRELMSHCDEFMDSVGGTEFGATDVLSDLDEALWDWFQEPPEEEAFKKRFNDFLNEMEEELVGEVDESGSGSKKEKETALEELDYRELQQRAKEAGIKANQKKEELVEALQTKTESTGAEGEGDQETGSPDTDGGSTSVNEDEESYRAELDVDPEMVSDFLMEANEQLEMLDNLLVEAEKDPTENNLNELFRAMHTLKGGFGFCGLEVCTDLTHAAEDLLDNLREDPPEDIPPVWMDLFFSTMDSVREICVGLETAVEEEESTLEADVSPEFMDRLKSDLRKACDGETEQDAFQSLEYARSAGEDRQEVGGETVNIELDQVGEIVDLVGELVISQSKEQELINGDLDRELEATLNQQEKILNQLQRKAMNLRMLPLKKEFNKLPRIVRDLSREQDKDIDLDIKGADTEIDKSVLDSLHGPLVHLIRNAVDHGIEAPAERKEKGKSETGHVEINAYQESGHVYIEISDDG